MIFLSNTAVYKLFMVSVKLNLCDQDEFRSKFEKYVQKLFTNNLFTAV